MNEGRTLDRHKILNLVSWFSGPSQNILNAWAVALPPHDLREITAPGDQTSVGVRRLWTLPSVRSAPAHVAVVGRGVPAGRGAEEARPQRLECARTTHQ